MGKNKLLPIIQVGSSKTNPAQNNLNSMRLTRSKAKQFKCDKNLFQGTIWSHVKITSKGIATCLKCNQDLRYLCKGKPFAAWITKHFKTSHCNIYRQVLQR